MYDMTPRKKARAPFLAFMGKAAPLDLYNGFPAWMRSAVAAQLGAAARTT